MASVFSGMINIVWSIAKIPLYIIGLMIVFFCISSGIYFLSDMIMGKRLKKPTERVYIAPKHKSIFRRLIFDLPRQFVTDLFNKEPGFFPYQGCVIFCGRQGAGKTVALVQYMRMMQESFPKCKVITNLAYTKEDDVLNDWRPLITYKNGIYGVIAAIDEMQNWFSSNQSKDFPPEMLQVITQNRKNRRILLGTAQVFTRLSKPLREQATEVRECKTLFGCLTIVHRKEPILSAEGDVTEYKTKGFYFFVHDQDLRDSYDTYKVIDSLAASGFQPRIVESTVKVNNYVVNKRK